MPKLTLPQLENHLFATADILRGKMDAKRLVSKMKGRLPDTDFDTDTQIGDCHFCKENLSHQLEVKQEASIRWLKHPDIGWIC